MIPIAIRGILPPRVRHTITKLCLFFNMIHSKVIDPNKLDEWQSEIILTLCQLEMYFPPSFFDVMVHLVSHIVGEIKACGPVFLRYMYPFERYMGFLKGYVRNRSRPEGSIIEGYASEEVIDFCTDYMEGVPNIGIPQSRHEGRLEGKGTIGRKDVTPNNHDIELAHFTVLQNMTSIAPYIHEHMSFLENNNIHRDRDWLETEHIRTFSWWLKDKVSNMLPNVDIEVVQLVYRPRRVFQYQGYDINGYTFYTKHQDRKSTVQNSGVTLVASTTDKSRLSVAKSSYYGVIEEIWELDYNLFVVPLFKCKWVNNIGGVKVDKDGMTCVNLSTNGYLSEPFILAKQATQVFFVEDPKDKRWHIVMHSKRRILGVENVVDEEEYNQFDEFSPFSIGIQSSDEFINDTTYLRSDHQEGHEDPPAQPPKKRGINKLQDLPLGASIEFNKFDKAIGKYRHLYGKYVGTTTRRNISILYKTWNDVSKEDKDLLWFDIKNHFRLENDGVKKQTLVSCGTKWRAFKNKLRGEYMLKNISPCRTWTFIEPRIWEEFCRNEQYTPEKLKRREIASERGKQLKNRPRLGSKGYAGFEDEWEEERKDPNKATELHLIPCLRGSNYCLARARVPDYKQKNKDKNKNSPPPPELLRISRDLTQASQQLAKGTIESQAGVDAMILVLGPEHGGRTRGVGGDIGYKKGIEGYVRKKGPTKKNKISKR